MGSKSRRLGLPAQTGKPEDGLSPEGGVKFRIVGRRARPEHLRGRFGLVLLAAWSGLIAGPTAARAASLPERAAAVPSPAPGAARFFFLMNWKVRNGDDPAWALGTQDDAAWETATLAGAWHRPGRYWLRKDLDLTVAPAEADPLTLFFYNLPSAFEVYWDGALLGRNGEVGPSRGRELAGATRFRLIVGDGFTRPGRHLLAVRVSNFHVPQRTIITNIGFGPLAAVESLVRPRLAESLVSLGLYFIAGLFAVLLFFRNRKNPSLLLFGGYAGLLFLHSASIYAIEALGLRVPVFARLEPLVVFGISLSLILLNAFILWNFEVRRRGLVAGGLAVGTILYFVALPLTPVNVSLLDGILLAWAFGLTLVLAFRRVRGIGLALAGTAVLAVYRIPALFSAKILTFLNSSPGFFDMAATAASLSFLMGVMALRIRDESRSLQALQLRAERLEADLLKKTIQPHFLMNTLLSIQSWFGRDPAKAGRLIEALADEFRIISRIASQGQIEAAEEIELCRLHLELMGYRRDADYRLALAGDFNGQKVPPMLFHTLIENGLTHAYAPRENGLFRLECRPTGEGVEYTLQNDGSLLAGLARRPAEDRPEGMGLKYVRTRLEESYPGRWDLEYGLHDGVWRVWISIRRAKAR
jgi:hypothetical protein